MTGTPGERMAEEAAAMRRLTPSTPDEAAVAAAIERQRTGRGEKAMAVLDASLRAAGIEGFSTGYEWENGRITVRFDSPTDAYLAATRLTYLRTGPHPGPGEGEPEHYEAIDRVAEYDREVGAAMSEPAFPGSAWANRRPPWPPAAERRLPEETGRRIGW